MEGIIPQGTEAWKFQRLGKVTASRVAEVIAKTKSGYSTSRANYAAQLIVERLTGLVQESYTNAAMQWGNDTEPQARAAYEFFSGNPVTEAPFILHPKIKMSGASPDGFVGNDGLVEIKCPNTATHIETLLGSSIDGKYLTQMQWQMACTGRKWCDFVSFDPRLPAELQIRITRINRSDETIENLEKEITDFLSEIDYKICSLTELAKKAA